MLRDHFDAQNVGSEREVDLEEAKHPRRCCLRRDSSLLSCKTAVIIGTVDISSEPWDFCSIFQIGVGRLTHPRPPPGLFWWFMEAPVRSGAHLETQVTTSRGTSQGTVRRFDVFFLETCFRGSF